MEGLERFRVAELTDDVVVLDRMTQVVYRIPGHLLDEVLSGRSMTGVEYLPTEAIPAIRAALSPGLLSRRRLIVAGSGVAAAGIVSAGLPFAAAASSPGLDASTYSAPVNVLAGLTSHSFNGGYDRTFRYAVAANTLSSTFQVALGATNGTAYQDTTAGLQGGGTGAYVIATIQRNTTAGHFVFVSKGGGQGGGQSGSNEIRGGYGGIAVGIYYSNNGNDNRWLLVAGGGGGSSAANKGGSWGSAGVGPAGRPGQGGTQSAGGAAGTSESPSGGGQTSGGSPILSSFWGGDLGSGGHGNRTAGSVFVGGGAGGAGYYGGGGGGGSGTETTISATSGGGGGGGSGFALTTSSVSLPYVTFHVTYTVPRAYSFDHSTVVREAYKTP